MSDGQTDRPLDDDAGFTTRFVRQYDQLRAFAAHLLKNERHLRMEKTSLVHRTFDRIEKTLAGPGAAKAREGLKRRFWAFTARAMRRTLIDLFRHRSAAPEGLAPAGMVESMDMAAEDDPDKRLVLGEAFEWLATLDPVDAQAVRLHYADKRSFAEINQILEIPNAAYRVSRTRRAMRSYLAGDAG